MYVSLLGEAQLLASTPLPRSISRQGPLSPGPQPQDPYQWSPPITPPGALLRAESRPGATPTAPETATAAVAVSSTAGTSAAPAPSHSTAASSSSPAPPGSLRLTSASGPRIPITRRVGGAGEMCSLRELQHPNKAIRQIRAKTHCKSTGPIYTRAFEEELSNSYDAVLLHDKLAKVPIMTDDGVLVLTPDRPFISGLSHHRPFLNHMMQLRRGLSHPRWPFGYVS